MLEHCCEVDLACTFLVDHLLAGDIPSIRKSLIMRYTMFSKSLVTSGSKEVRVLASIAAGDIRSNMGRNIFKIHQETKLDPLSSSKVHVGALLSKSTVEYQLRTVGNCLS